jgi:hypothetical protein
MNIINYLFCFIFETETLQLSVIYDLKLDKKNFALIFSSSLAFM